MTKLFSLPLTVKLSLIALMSVLGGAMGGPLGRAIARRAVVVHMNAVWAMLDDMKANHRPELLAQEADAQGECEPDGADEAAEDAAYEAGRWRWSLAFRSHLYLNWSVVGGAMTRHWPRMGIAISKIFQNLGLGLARNCVLFVPGS